MTENKIVFATAARAQRAQTVYGLMTGAFNLDVFESPFINAVNSEYTVGTEAAELTNEIYAAKQRLCTRTGLDEEDADLYALVDAYEALMKLLGTKMYHYGAALEKDAEA